MISSMEGGTEKDVKQPVAFHSSNISDTKAREKREVFVKVEEKKTLRQSAEEFQKKFAEAKAHAAESRAKIENPGADERGVIRSRQRFSLPWKKIIKTIVIIIIVAGLGIGGYLAYPAIKERFTPTVEKAVAAAAAGKCQESIQNYQGVIDSASSATTKADLLQSRIMTLFQNCHDQSSSQILKDAYAAEELSPSAKTAYTIWFMESEYGDAAKAEEWRVKSEERGGSTEWGEG